MSSEPDLPKLIRHLPRVPHRLTHDIVELLAAYYTEHVRRDVGGGLLLPTTTWELLNGFIFAAAQTYTSICLLLAHKRVKPFVLQAAVLNRSLFETLVTVCALVDDPEPRTTALMRDSYRLMALRLRDESDRFGNDPAWAEHLSVMRQHVERRACDLQMPLDLIAEPVLIPEWPTPGRLIFGRGDQRPLVSGTRRDVLIELYRNHYASLSAQAHGRVLTMAMAWFAEHPEEHWNPGANESNHITWAQIYVACVFAEVSSHAGYDVHPKLLELWAYLREIDGLAIELWRLRYGVLLNSERAGG